MIKRFTVVYFFVLFSCGNPQVSEPVDLLIDKGLKTKVGDIVQDSIVDGNFKICHGEQHILQYYAFDEKPYAQEKLHIENYFKSNFKTEQANEKSGFLRFRFVVNCKGMLGRIRVLGSDFNYKAKEFNENTVAQLQKLLKNYNGFKVLQKNGYDLDYYHYIVFKIENGHITEVLP